MILNYDFYLNFSLMVLGQVEETMEYALQDAEEIPTVHLDKFAWTLAPLVEQEKKRYLI